MRKVIVNLEEFPYWNKHQGKLKRQFGSPTPQEKTYNDIEKTYLKYLKYYATQDVIVVTDKVEGQVYKAGAEEITVVKPTYLTKLLNHKRISSIEVRNEIDKTAIIYKDSDILTKWIEVESKDAEAARIKPKTKRIHKKPQKQINKENKILFLLQLLPIILPIPLIIYSYNTENIAGLGIMTGISLGFLLQIVQNRKTTYPYERRI